MSFTDREKSVESDTDTNTYEIVNVQVARICFERRYCHIKRRKSQIRSLSGSPRLALRHCIVCGAELWDAADPQDCALRPAACDEVQKMLFAGVREIDSKAAGDWKRLRDIAGRITQPYLRGLEARRERQRRLECLPVVGGTRGVDQLNRRHPTAAILRVKLDPRRRVGVKHSAAGRRRAIKQNLAGKRR